MENETKQNCCFFDFPPKTHSDVWPNQQYALQPISPNMRKLKQANDICLLQGLEQNHSTLKLLSEKWNGVILSNGKAKNAKNVNIGCILRIMLSISRININQICILMYILSSTVSNHNFEFNVRHKWNANENAICLVVEAKCARTKIAKWVLFSVKLHAESWRSSQVNAI